MTAEHRIKDMGIVLPPVSAPAANYANAARTGNLLFISGKAPSPENGKYPKGRLGREFTTEDGYRFARSAALESIAVIRDELGSLDKVARVVEVQGFLNTSPEFEEHAKVLNGCSDLLYDIFRERGIHARSVVGANSLRGGLVMTLRMVVEVVT